MPPSAVLAGGPCGLTLASLAPQFEMLQPRIPQGLQGEDRISGIVQVITQLLIDLIRAYVSLFPSLFSPLL